MRRSIITVDFAALVAAGIGTAANAVPAGPALITAKATETSVTRVYWQYSHCRRGYRPRVYGYYSRPYRYSYRPKVYGYYGPRAYGRGYRGCWW
jgi:hypothetical protein